MTDLSVVIGTLKHKDAILCLPKFEDSDFDDYEVIIRGDEGIAKARNEGIKQASADKIVFIDDDAEPMDGYLQAAANILEDEYVVAGKVIHPGNGIISRIAAHYPTGHEGQYVEDVVGCNMGYRRKVFDTIGFFDENFLWGHEETEFIKRVKKEYPVYYEPEMGVVHSYANGVVDFWRKQYRLGPADVYLEKKNGKTDRDIIKELLNPMRYFTSDPRTLPIELVGNICNRISRVQALRQKNTTNKRN